MSGGFYALHCTSRHSDTLAVRHLMSTGCDINVPDSAVRDGGGRHRLAVQSQRREALTVAEAGQCVPPVARIDSVTPRGAPGPEHYRKMVFCRMPESSPCALFRAHDEDLLCRVSPEEHTAKKKHTGNLTLRRVPRASTRQTLLFAVCQPVGTRRTWITCGAHPSAVRGPHGRYCLPCARARHTANSHLRRVPVG